MAPDRAKGANELFCRSCGEPIKQNAEICPHCGVRNTRAAAARSARGSTPSGRSSTTASRPASGGQSSAGQSSAGQSSAGQSSAGQSSAGQSTSSESSATPHTTVSDTWWYGVAGGVALWVLLFAASTVLAAPGELTGLLTLVAWLGTPAAAYYDMQYVRANSDWDPNTVLWVVLLLLWVVNIAAAGAYLYRRHEALGQP